MKFKGTWVYKEDLGDHSLVSLVVGTQNIGQIYHVKRRKKSPYTSRLSGGSYSDFHATYEDAVKMLISAAKSIVESLAHPQEVSLECDHPKKLEGWP